jgi:hypothetical protein
MNWLIRSLFGFHPMMVIEGDAAAGGGTAQTEIAEVELDDGEEATPPDAEPAPGTPPADKAKEPPSTENAMLDGIKKALNPADAESEKKPLHGAAAASAKKKADAEFAASLEGKTPEEIAAATAAREAEAKKKADAEELAKLKGKKADDFMLTPEEKKVATQGMQQRIHQLHRYAKEQETTVAKLTETNAGLSKFRDDMMGVFDEHLVQPEDLGVLLDYNKRLKTGDLAGALKIVDDARAAIHKAMGKEGPGVDLLAEFPDLQKKVDDLEMKREYALEIANARRREAARESAQRQAHSQQSEQQRTASEVKKAEESALVEIDRWSVQMAKEDIDFAKKEEKISPQMTEIVKEYPAQLWLPTIKRLYGSIQVVKEAAPPPAGGGPLRPSGAKPGAKTFTELTPEALRAGLGYPPAA